MMRFITVEGVSALVIFLIVFFIFTGDTGFLERVVYGFIAAVCTYLLVMVTKYTVLWCIKAFKK